MIEPKPGQLWKWTNTHEHPHKRFDMFIVMVIGPKPNSRRLEYKTVLVHDMQAAGLNIAGDDSDRLPGLRECWDLSCVGWELMSDATSD